MEDYKEKFNQIEKNYYLKLENNTKKINSLENNPVNKLIYIVFHI